MHPACGQCKKSGRQCLGFETDHGGLLFLSENSYASGRSPRRPRGGGRRSPVRRELVKGEASKAPPARRESTPKPSSPQQDLAFSPPLSPNLEELAVASFTHSYLANPTSHKREIWYFLGQPGFEWGATYSPSAYNLAATAVSMAVFSRKHHCSIALAESRTKYNAALAKTRALINSEAVASKAPTDQLLLAVMLLAAYEDRVCNFNHDTLFLEGYRHQDGALALLEMRKRVPFTSEHSLLLDRETRRQILRSSLLRGSELPPWLVDGAAFGEEGEEGNLDQLVVETIQLRYRMVRLFECFRNTPESERHTLRGHLDHGIKNCKDIDTALHEWSESLPPEYGFRSMNHNTAFSNDSLFYPGPIHWYESIDHATLHNRCRATRMVCNGMMTVCLRHKTLSSPSPSLPPAESRITDECKSEIPSPTETMISTARLTIRAMADELCASVPYHFNLISPADPFSTTTSNPSTSPKTTTHPNLKIDIPTDPLKDAVSASVTALVWPITIASASAALSGTQRAWLQRKLAFVGMVLGSGVLEGLSKVSLYSNFLLSLVL